MGITEDMLARIDAITPAAQPATWFLDVDGVLNALGEHPREWWPAYARTVVTNSEGIVHHLLWSTDLVEVINRLIQRRLVIIRWLTTWEYDAATIVAPALKLVNPHGSWWVAGLDDGRGDAWWKLQVIREYMLDENGYFIWTDDDIRLDIEALQLTDFLHPAQALVICPDKNLGLTPADLLQIIGALETR